MEQPEELETDQYEIEIEADYLDSKEFENTNTRPKRANTEKGVERLKIKFGGKINYTQFTTRTGE